MDIDRKDAARLALQVIGEILPPLAPELMGEAVRDEGVKALEIEQRFDQPVAGGIALVNGVQVGTERVGDLGRCGQSRLKRLIEQCCINIGMIQPLRQPVRDRVLQPVMVENGREDEAAKRWLARDRGLGLLAHFGPDGVDAVETRPRGHIRGLCHAPKLLSGFKVPWWSTYMVAQGFFERPSAQSVNAGRRGPCKVHASPATR